MNIQYVCELYFEKGKSNQKELMELVLHSHSLGFTPNVMSIYVTLDEMYEEVSYAEDFLFSLLSREKDSGVTISQQDYDENIVNSWFKLSRIEGNFFSLRWSNENLNFLIQKNIADFLKMDGFAAGYIFDNKDVWEQSRIAKENKSSRSIDYPGQFKYVCGMQFMAAPLMWFGKPFFEIISKDMFLEFNDANIDEQLSPNIVEVKLFDVYDPPTKGANRDKQKQFWTFFDLDKVVLKYEKDNAIDAAQALADFLKKR